MAVTRASQSQEGRNTQNNAEEYNIKSLKPFEVVQGGRHVYQQYGDKTGDDTEKRSAKT